MKPLRKVKVKGFDKQTSWKISVLDFVFFYDKMSKKSDADMYIYMYTYTVILRVCATHYNHTHPHTRGLWFLLSFTRACLEFLTTLTFRALHSNHIVSTPFETTVFFLKKNTETWKITSSNEQTRHTSTSPRHATCFSSILFSYILDSYVFLFIFVQPRHHRTIQYLIPGRTTNVELLKQVTNWQNPSRDPWSNCPIHSRETTKSQTNYFSGRQKKQFKDNLSSLMVSGVLSKFSSPPPA